jgi:PAS domain S-box-containing protein
VAKKSARPSKAATRAASAASPTLRQQAETKLRAVASPGQARPSDEEPQRVLHELQVHQIELEMQNEELRRSQAELEASRAGYVDLYDLAPVGYVTLSENGLILEANLTVAGQLGVERSALAGQPLTRFIVPEDQDVYYQHRRQLLETGTLRTCELRLARADGVPFWAGLRMTATNERTPGAGASDVMLVCRAVITDISVRKEAEAQVARTLAEVQEHAAETEAILTTLSDAVLIYDAGMNVVKANSYFIANYGFDPAGLNVRDVLARVDCRWPDGRPSRPEDQPTPRALRGAAEAGARFRVRPPGASAERMVETASAPLRAGGRLLGSVTVWHDVTEREQLLRQAQASAEELQAANQILQRQAEELRRSLGALAEAEIAYRYSFPDANPNPVLQLDRQGAIIYCNPATDAWLERLGCPGEPQALVPPDIGALVERLAQGEAAQVACEVTLGGAIFGEGIHLLPQLGVIRIYARDITARKRTEDNLRLSEERFRRLVEASPDAISLADGEGTLLLCNQKAADLLGFESAGAMIGMNFREFFPPQQWPRAAESMQRARTDGMLRDVERSLLRRDGSSFAAELSVAWTSGTDSNPEYFVAIIRDVTARKEAETRIRQLNADLEARVRERTAQLEAANRELRASEEKYRTVADFTYDWEYWLGPDGRYRYVSPACERITGYRPEEFQNEPTLLESITHPDDRAQVAEHLRESESVHTPGSMDFRIVARSGEVRWIGHWCQPVYTSDGRWLGRRASNRDITAQRQAEALQQEMEVLQQIDRLRADLIGNVSHELRTPLGLILVMVTALRKDYIFGDIEKRSRILRDIEEEARNLQGIVDQLLDESHLQSGRLALDRHLVDLRSLIRRTAELLTAQALQHPLTCQLPETELLAFVDARRIEQVLRNLLDNAVKYTPAGAAITVRAEAQAGAVRIAVSDEGPGIPPAEREHIFERFYRLVSPHAPPRPGLGLGLSICRGIVEEHGGTLWVEERTGGGSVFVLTLPSGIESTAALAPRQEPNEGEIRPASQDRA